MRFEILANFYAVQTAYEHKLISNPAGTVLICKLTETNRKTNSNIVLGTM